MMDIETNDLVELGTASGDTAGEHGLPLEMGGREDWAGLTQD
ncbi:hypothetical protein [Sphingopyxis granuli]|jgi:hypothetical protein|nr:hypothetical protein [Sphingopyxis granuli]